jgi:flagellar hook assembly protein FlgD
LAGNQAQWDGNNESGRPVSPGVYLYSVTAGSTVERGKIVVAR